LPIDWDIGTWTPNLWAGLDIIGKLIVLKSGDDSFDLRFQFRPTSGANINSGVHLIEQ